MHFATDRKLAKSCRLRAQSQTARALALGKGLRVRAGNEVTHNMREPCVSRGGTTRVTKC